VIYFQDLKDNLENDQVGSKAYSLSTMLNSGINVPKGFVINKFAYQNYKEQPDFLLKHKTTLASYLKKLKAKKLMVRSSAIGEDSKDASFAGQLESYQSENSLEAVIENILKCWSSLQSNRVKEYEQKQGRALVDMAVIIQEMIEPEYAGVLFTTSPITQEGKYLEYIEGHAEKLVQGEVTPESIEIDESTDTSKMPFNVRDLLSQSEKILKRYQDIPQDIEWAYKDKTFYFVQSRPITTLKDKIKWSNTNVNENYPDKLSPLLYSVAKQSYYHYYKNLALNLGVIKKDDPRAERYFANAIGIFGHRMYYNMSSIHNMINLTPIAKLLQKSFDDFVGYQKENKLNDKLSRGFENIKIAWKIFYHLLNLGQKVNTMEVAISDYAQKNKEQLSYNDLTKSFHTFLFIRFHLWVNASFADFYAMLTHGALGKFLEKVKVENPQGVQNGLIQGIPNLISNQPLLHLWQMNLLIKLKPHLKDLMKKTPEDILEQLQTNEDYSELKELVDLYLEEWGFRCPGELTFLSKNYIENPLSFIKMLKAYRDGKPENPQRLLDLKHAEQVNLAYETKIYIRRVFKLRPLKKYIYTFILSLLTKLTIFSIASRERVRLKQAQMYYTFKKTCLALGHYWLNKGLFNDANDIFYLEYTEINRILSGEEIDNEYIHNLILLRKKSIEKANQAPDNFYSFREDLGSKIFDQDINIESVDGHYKGLGACSGKVLGKIVVVENIDQIGKINKGDILVTKQTDPGWICVFPMISGLIVEKGGILSHSAIVAREFGIPAVVGLPKITEHLQDGQKVEVDGSLGVVRCLD
jgi:phosphohistidine swiveling domain-containing protein